uniref:NADH-ubiquinone oxidoreductase chain 4 n=1 Tax=Janus sp. TaxID=3003420 RepID=A0A9E8YYW4_9HYME|nr:NADH dehydrogenase subunit 4 [Janus sp.]
MMKYFIILIMLIMIFMVSGSMLNILFQNLILLIFFFFFFEFSFLSYNFIDFCSLQYFYGLDYFSFWMIILSMWISVLMMLASMKIIKENKFSGMFILTLLIMLVILIFTFSVLNFLLFYFFFEASLIPIVLVILGWGYQVERIRAATYLLMYTMFFSFPFLGGLFYIYYLVDSMDMIILNNGGGVKIINSSCLYMLIMNVFFVKMPMFLYHMWLPKAHVEAPVAGSMILAGVMLKLGGYGMYRSLFLLESKLSSNSYYLVFSLWGGLCAGFICMRQLDMKSLVAYSSVVHMSLVISGFLSVELVGVQGAFMMMIAHGLCSSGLFCLVNMIYERTLSRSLIINKGLLVYSPIMMMMWFFLCIGNMSAPPSLNLISEIFLLISLIGWESYLFILLMTILFISSCYSLYLFSYTCYGVHMNLYMYNMFSVREYILILMHLIPLNLLILSFNFF